jgi:hypothetical protein
MNACERYEMEISALLDGESTPAGAIEVLDHVTRCPSCRHFYQEARAFHECVGGLSAPSPTDSDLPVVVSGSGTIRAPGHGRVLRLVMATPRWTWPLAAALVLALGWWGARGLAGRTDLPMGTDIPLTIQLGGDPEGMNDARFVELTRELLQADQGYRRMMLGLLSALDHGEDETEGAPRYAVHQVEGSEGDHHEEFDEHAESMMRFVN